MARVFISFAIEDKVLRDFLIGQKRNTKSSIDFTDYSVKEPWENAWKTQCRQRIRCCAGMIGIITHNTNRADGQLWELQCAIDENIPLLLIHGYTDASKKIITKPSVISGLNIQQWTEDNIFWFLNRIG